MQIYTLFTYAPNFFIVKISSRSLLQSSKTGIKLMQNPLFLLFSIIFFKNICEN